jgi:hypothetical protein
VILARTPTSSLKSKNMAWSNYAISIIGVVAIFRPKMRCLDFDRRRKPDVAVLMVKGGRSGALELPADARGCRVELV